MSIAIINQIKREQEQKKSEIRAQKELNTFICAGEINKIFLAQSANSTLNK